MPAGSLASVVDKVRHLAAKCTTLEGRSLQTALETLALQAAGKSKSCWVVTLTGVHVPYAFWLS